MAVSGESRPHSLDNSAIILDQVGRPPHLDRTQSFKGGLRRQSTQYQLIESNETIRWHRHSTTIFDASIDTTLAFIPLTNATLEFTLLVYLLSTYLSLPGMLQAISRASQKRLLNLALHLLRRLNPYPCLHGILLPHILPRDLLYFNRLLPPPLR